MTPSPARLPSTDRERRPGAEWATVAFVDLAGFSAIADVYGDKAAIDVLEVFEAKVRDVLSGSAPPIKWIGDEAMVAFPNQEAGIRALGQLLQACQGRTADTADAVRSEPWPCYSQRQRHLLARQSTLRRA